MGSAKLHSAGDGIPALDAFSSGDLGAAQLMQEALQRHPDWISVLASGMGRMMRQDGFLNRALDRYDAADYGRLGL